MSDPKEANADESTGGHIRSDGTIDADGPSLGKRLGDIWNDPARGLTGEKNRAAVFEKAKKTVTGKNRYGVDRAEKNFRLLVAAQTGPASHSTHTSSAGAGR